MNEEYLEQVLEYLANEVENYELTLEEAQYIYAEAEEEVYNDTKLAIYEACHNGDITETEQYELLSYLSESSINPFHKKKSLKSKVKHKAKDIAHDVKDKAEDIKDDVKYFVKHPFKKKTLKDKAKDFVKDHKAEVSAGAIDGVKDWVHWLPGEGMR